MKRLLELAKRGDIQTILVKDLSRWGRNYPEVSEYLDQIFPFLGIRFVSVNDQYNSSDYLGQAAPMSIVDATIIEAPTSTKNASKQRDPEMHQVKKGNEWHFGMRMHVGVDAGTGYIHSLEVNKANSSEVVTAPLLIRPDDEVVYGDAGYTGLHKRPEVTTNAHLRSIGYRINTKNPHRWKSLAPGFDWERHFEYQKSRIRSKVEYVFLIIKRMFHYRKVRYRGIAKNKSHAYILGACANLFMLAQSGWQQA